jgi:hypothetical protein
MMNAPRDRLSTMTLLASVLAAAALSAGPATAGDDVWLLEQARAPILRLGSERWSGDVAEALAAARPLPATDPVVAELAPLLAEAAVREPRGPAPAPLNAPVPRPGWRLAWLDLDGDGEPEIVLAGGSSPAPYYAVFDRVGTAWRLLHDAPFRFLSAATHGGRLHLLSVFDGYGVAGSRLAVDTIDSTGRSKQHLVFSLMEWPATGTTGATASAPVSGCTTARTTALRSTAVRDDHPTDRGTETLAPGNVFQTLAAGSTGWVLQTVRGEDGEPWSLCCFVGEAAAPLHPRTLHRRALASSGRALVGWVRTRDLTMR